MFGLEFLFLPALLALPLAALPIVLHLLYRRKSPVVPFSTVRFVKASIQQTAARKRIQRWLLLLCRALLLTLLILAVSQPAKRLGAAWFGSQSMVAAIVVDTSYSMQLQEHQTPLLTSANDATDQLLRGPLQNARVAIFTSQPGDPPEQFQSVGEIEKNWRELQPQPAAAPLAERIVAAADLLRHEEADHRWLVVLSDLQRREFPRALPEFPDGQTILLDLHPRDVRAAAITKVACEPAQPRLGIASQVAVEVAGRGGDWRAIDLSVSPADHPQTPIAQPNMPMAKLESGSRAVVRVPFAFQSQSWLLLKASLQSGDDLPWAASRTELLKVPPPASTTVLQLPRANAAADRNLRLALDPGEGANPAWPIKLLPAAAIQGDEDIVAVNVTDWPDETTANRLAEMARRGGTIDLFFQPGLEQTWPQLPQSRKDAIGQLLPGPPVSPTEQGPFHGSIARADDPIFTDVGDIQSASGKLRLSRIVPFEIADPSATVIISAASDNPAPGSKLRALLVRRKIGAGQVYIWATLPAPLYGNLATYELFLPVLVNSSMRSEAQTQMLNVEIGNRIVLPADQAPAGAESLDLLPPQGPAFVVSPVNDPKLGKCYISQPLTDPGLYTWKSGEQTIAYTNAQYPAAEADLQYRPAADIARNGPGVIVSASVGELQLRLNKAAEPEACWTVPIALVLFLLCLEALMGSVSKLWKPIRPRFFPTPARVSD